MTQQAGLLPAERLREFFQPARRPPADPRQRARPWWRPAWSQAAAARALRATLVVPSMLALTFKVIGNEQMALFAVFGSFGALVLSSFGGSRLNKVRAHFGLAVVGSIALIIGTVASSSALLAALVTLPVGFFIYFGGMLGPNAANGVTAALLAYVLPVASSGGAATIPSRLEGWWLANAVALIAVLLISPRSPGDRLRASASLLAAALARHLKAAVAGTATQADLDATRQAKHDLIALYEGTPYRPIGIASADQALASVITLLQWAGSLVTEAMDGHLDVSGASDPDKDLLAESAIALGEVATLLATGDGEPSLERLWNGRAASAEHMRSLEGSPDEVRVLADHAFHAQAIGIATSAAAVDALVAAGRLGASQVDELRNRWLPGFAGPFGSGSLGPARGLDAGDITPARPSGARRPMVRPPLPRPSTTILADASIRSVWFKNSLRGACALAVAVAVARLIDVQHAFWVVLGTLSVLRSSAGATSSTALRAMTGTVVGFAIGGALLVGIGSTSPALWAALPIAVLVAAYSPGTLPFAVGQAAFTVTVVVLFNLLVPAGWRVGLVRVEDVAIGTAVSVVVGFLFWPHGVSSVVGDNLAQALRAGAAQLRQATAWALGLDVTDQGQRMTEQGSAAAAVAAAERLDDAIRAYLTEQGSKRLDKQDLFMLSMSALRLRLTADSLASLPIGPAGSDGRAGSSGAAAGHPIGPATRTELVHESDVVAGFFDAIAAEVGRPGHRAGPLPAVAVPPPFPEGPASLCPVGVPHYHPDALWVRDHLSHLSSHTADLVGPAERLAALRRRPWWR
jgi:uncharacterized membrane protein YccC